MSVCESVTRLWLYFQKVCDKAANMDYFMWFSSKILLSRSQLCIKGHVNLLCCVNWCVIDLCFTVCIQSQKIDSQ